MKIKKKLPTSIVCVKSLWLYIKGLLASVETHLKSKYFEKFLCPLAGVRWLLALADAAEARKRELKNQFVRYGRDS